MDLYVGIATCGRKELLERVVCDLERQSCLPKKIYISPINLEKDVGDIVLPSLLKDRVIILQGPAGSCAQRNTILSELKDAEGIILFLDDDFLLHKEYCRELKKIYESNNEIVGVAGNVLADGINSPGIGFEEALKIVEEYTILEEEALTDNPTTYGCNMSFRLETLHKTGIVFDERLPLYGWFEDLDFSFQVSRHGRVTYANRCAGVHMGHKSGRTSGLRLGYSQVVNPVYLWKKGTMPPGVAIKSVIRRILANLIRSVRPEAWVDRSGRVRGNIIGLIDLIKGKADPRRILEF